VLVLVRLWLLLRRTPVLSAGLISAVAPLTGSVSAHHACGVLSVSSCSAPLPPWLFPSSTFTSFFFLFPETVCPPQPPSPPLPTTQPLP
jgi:hypothetical protein